jgi:hypothetical protein
MRLVSAKLRWAPFSAREIFVRSVEFAAAFPNDHLAELTLEGARMPVFVYLGLDFLLPALLLAVVGLAVVVRLLLFILVKLRLKGNPKNY